MNIEFLTENAPEPLLIAAGKLLLEYGHFLRQTGTHNAFRYDLLDAEVVGLPASYIDSGGALLVATEAGEPAGCIAYRSCTVSSDLLSCELKRLFVRPNFRGRGLGAQLITEALQHARLHGYQAVILDTNPHSMAAALHTYRKLGFSEYSYESGAPDPDLLYLRRNL